MVTMGSSPQQHETGRPTPPAQPALSPYQFPCDKLKRRLQQANKTPLVLVACGSFSPITILHLELFELAARYVEHTEFEVVGNYMSPCSDTYGKSSLVPAHHRINMCTLAIEERRSDVMVDEWETLRRDSSGRPMYTPTTDVLKRFDKQLNDVLGGIQTLEGTFVRARVVLLLGADLAFTMGDPDVWSPSDIDVLLGKYGAFVVERPTQCDIKDVQEALKKYQDKIWIVPSYPNDVSSTRVRLQIQNGEMAMDLPKSVLTYINKHGLYQASPLKENEPQDTNGSSEQNTSSLDLPVESQR
ncbi:hypothetical protein G7046_g2803 [Stylonectria norvegica]|nr:hypothetical protein G7046_g2803 [Stylonectria norvegica]